jgi:hypothetical protein
VINERAERRLTAILAADVAGYSRLMGIDEEGTLARLKAHRRELVAPKIAEHRGRIVRFMMRVMLGRHFLRRAGPRSGFDARLPGGPESDPKRQFDLPPRGRRALFVSIRLDGSWTAAQSCAERHQYCAFGRSSALTCGSQTQIEDPRTHYNGGRIER